MFRTDPRLLQPRSPKTAPVPAWFALRGRRAPAALAEDRTWWAPPERDRFRRAARAASAGLARALRSARSRPAPAPLPPVRCAPGARPTCREA